MGGHAALSRASTRPGMGEIAIRAVLGLVQRASLRRVTRAPPEDTEASEPGSLPRCQGLVTPWLGPGEGSRRTAAMQGWSAAICVRWSGRVKEFFWTLTARADRAIDVPQLLLSGGSARAPYVEAWSSDPRRCDWTAARGAG